MELWEFNISEGLNEFITQFRNEIVSLLKETFKDKWQQKFVDCLDDIKKEGWRKSLKSGRTPEDSVDLQHFKSFALKYKTLLREQFDVKVHMLPTWFDEIALVRHHIAHCTPYYLSNDDVTKAWINMISITEILQRKDLAKNLRYLRKRQKINKEEVGKEENEFIIRNAGKDKSEISKIENKEFLQRPNEENKSGVEDRRHDPQKFKAITNDVQMDFSMVENLSWISIKNHMISVGDEIHFDFEKGIIFGKSSVRPDNVVNYKTIISQFFEENPAYAIDEEYEKRYRNPYPSFESYQWEVKRLFSKVSDKYRKKYIIIKFSLTKEMFSGSQMAIEIGNKEANPKFSFVIVDELKLSQIRDIYLFYCYITSYIFGMNVNLIINRSELNAIEKGYYTDLYIPISLFDIYLSDAYLGPLSSSNSAHFINLL